MPTINQIRSELKQKYSSKRWDKKVNSMSDEQAIAIWYSILEQARKRQEKEKLLEEKKVSQLELFSKQATNLTNVNSNIFECGEGWHQLIKNTLKDIQLIASQKDLEVNVYQIKEKFGGLRIYLSVSVPEIDNLVELAEQQSKTICEICGNPGFFGGNMDGWYMTRCMDCMPKGTFILEDI